MRRNVTIICDLQFGSTGKGLIAGYLAKRDKPDVIVTAWSPNAGHTFIDEYGNKMIHTMLANGIVSPYLKYVLIGPGSVVNLNSLYAEIKQAQEFGYLLDAKVLIHPHAAIVDERHLFIEEASMTAIGSTKKGAGAALIEKITRNPKNKIIAEDFRFATGSDPAVTICTKEDYDFVIDNAERIHLEGAQGYSLGMNSGFYPYTTSRECTPAQMLSDCLIPIGKLLKVIGTARTYPIRVANRYDDNGNMVGWSGPGYHDQKEISWDELGVPPEQTTVTKLTRRVFTFSNRQIADAMRLCQPHEVFLNFANYMSEDQVNGMVRNINRIYQKVGLGVYGTSVVEYIGDGPTENHIHELSAMQDRKFRRS